MFYPTRQSGFKALVAVVTWLLLVTPAPAQDQLGVDELIEISGVLDQIRQLPEVFRNIGEELSAVSADENFSEDFDVVVRDVIDVEEMTAEYVAIFHDRFPSRFEAPHLEFLQTPLGRRIKESERFSTSYENKELTASVGARILETLRDEDPERLQNYEQLINETGLIEHTESIASNMGYAMLVGVFASGKGAVVIPHDQIIGLLKAGRAKMRKEIVQTIMRRIASTYRDFSKEEILIYSEFLRKEPAQKFNETIYIAIDTVISARALAFGHRLAEQRNSRKT